MSDNTEIEGVAKVAAEIIKAVPIYDDTIQPVAKEVGKALGTLGGVINIAISPLAGMVYGFDMMKDQLTSRLEKRLKNTLPENIIAPKLQIVGPLLEKYKYTHDSGELSEMFVNLLANAMDKNLVEKAHPSFVNIISELSPDEAKLVKIISTEMVLPKIDINMLTNEDGKSGQISIKTNITLLGQKATVQYPELTPSYLSNLERLMIIQCSSGSLQSSYVDKNIYKPLEELTEVKEFLSISTEAKKYQITQGTIVVTDFGRMFMSAVL